MTCPHEVLFDGHLNEVAVSVLCPVCGALPGVRCTVDPDARPYPSTMRVGLGAPYHIIRGRTICGRVLVGRGDDTSDPLCTLPEHHGGCCEP